VFTVHLHVCLTERFVACGMPTELQKGADYANSRLGAHLWLGKISGKNLHAGQWHNGATIEVGAKSNLSSHQRRFKFCEDKNNTFHM
jgi:hypothetical protein